MGASGVRQFRAPGRSLPADGLSFALGSTRSGRSSSGSCRSIPTPCRTRVLRQMLRTVLLQQGELHVENDKLRLLVQRLLRHQFGRRFPSS
jgi:hypothetical protein